MVSKRQKFRHPPPKSEVVKTCGTSLQRRLLTLRIWWRRCPCPCAPAQTSNCCPCCRLEPGVPGTPGGEGWIPRLALAASARTPPHHAKCPAAVQTEHTKQTINDVQVLLHAASCNSFPFQGCHQMCRCRPLNTWPCTRAQKYSWPGFNYRTNGKYTRD